MRPVARIAQSVEQGIENPRVLGSIPSPGTTYSEKPACGLVFCFLVLKHFSLSLHISPFLNLSRSVLRPPVLADSTVPIRPSSTKPELNFAKNETMDKT